MFFIYKNCHRIWAIYFFSRHVLVDLLNMTILCEGNYIHVIVTMENKRSYFSSDNIMRPCM